MPSPTHPSRYPPEFLAAFQAVQKRGELSIPSGNPHALKAKLWGFQRALRLHNQAELADSVQVLVPKEPGKILLRLRTQTVEARELRAALDQAGENSLPLSTPDADEAFNRIF